MSFKARKFSRGVIHHGRKHIKDISIAEFTADFVWSNHAYNAIAQCSMCPKVLDDENDVAEYHYSHLLQCDVFLCTACAEKQRIELNQWLDSEEKLSNPVLEQSN